MRRHHWAIGATLVAVAGTLTTCWGAEQPPISELSRLEVVAAVSSDVDAAGVRVEVTGCEHARPVGTRTLVLKAGADRFISDRPIGLAKGHLFARESWSVPPGCYRARAVPVGPDAAPIEGCVAAETPPMPLGPNGRRDLVLLARCGEAPFDTPSIDGKLNFAPHITQLSKTDSSKTDPSKTTGVEICARARDPESDALFVEWSVTAGSASDGNQRPLRPPAAHKSKQVGDTLDECIRLERPEDALDVSARVFDGVRDRSRGFASHESRRLHRHSIATPSHAKKTLHLEPDSSDTCPAENRARVSAWTYWIHRDGRLLAPTDDLDALEPGDDLEVEMLVDGCGRVPVELTSSRRREHGPIATDMHPTDVHDRNGGAFESGTHILSLKVPDAAFDVRLKVGLAGGLVLDATGTEKQRFQRRGRGER